MSNENMITMIGLIVGGLAIFIYGIQLMSDALKSIAGTRIREYIEKYTKNIFMSILVGTIISALLHSSSAVTVISISLVRAGLMGLLQAIGITIGANIGTCITSIMIGLNIEEFSYYFVFSGVLLMFISKRKKYTYIGKVLTGFGLIFIGLEMMSNELVTIAQQPWFTNLMVTIARQPWLALLGATVATAIMQSSTAIIGIVQKLYVTGTLSSYAGCAFIFGANVGTCMTAVMAAFGGSIATRRAALFHAVYNALGALIGMIVLTPFVVLTQSMNQLMGGGPEMFVALSHFIFNMASTILVIPFVNRCVKLLKLLIPGEDNKDLKIENIDELDDQLIHKLPVAALEVAKKNTLRMGRNVIEIIKLSQAYLTNKDEESYDEVIEVEALVNKYDTLLSEYLLKIANEPTLSDKQTQEYYKNYQIVKYFEQMSDQVNQIVDFYHMVYEEQGDFSKSAIDDINILYHQLFVNVSLALDIFDSQRLASSLLKMNQECMTFEHLLLSVQQNHFERMKQGEYQDTIATSVLMDIYSHLDRINDLSLDIANRTFVAYKKHQQKYLDPSQI